MNIVRKRPCPSGEGSDADMIEQQPSKRPRPRIVKSRLSSEEHRAIETVAKLLNKPVSEFYDEDLHDTSVGTESTLADERPPEDVVYADPEPWPVSEVQWQPTDAWQQDVGGDELDGSASQLTGPWTQPSGMPFDESYSTAANFNQWSQGNSQISAIHLVDGRYDTIVEGRIYRSPGWSHDATSDEPWLAVPTGFLDRASYEEGLIDSSGGGKSPGMIAVPPQEFCSTSRARGPRQDAETKDRSPNQSSSSPPSDLLGSDDIDQDWEDLKPQEPSSMGQLAPLAKNTTSSWTMTELPKPYQTFLLDKSAPKSVEWALVDLSGEGASSQRPQRRGPFQCQINTNDPSGICQTCQAVSKQKIHTLPCMRYKLTECTLYRIGKAPGLEFTFRWPVMKLKDISDWSDNQIRTIKVMSDVCPVPLELSVRRFVPHPEDSLQKSWMDGKVLKFKTTTPFAIVNMNTAKDGMRHYINEHIFVCMEYWLRGRDELILETFKYARTYMQKAPDEEQSLLADYFRLWFASRRTATTESIVGDDTLDMEPETTDRSYPLFGKVPLPPVMIQQLDMILTLGFLQPLRKKVLEQFNRIVLKNNPKSWMTIYLLTFMSLQSCAAFTAENYQNARKHGLKRRFAMPNFISERHHSSNVFLSHYHYCTKPCNPFNIDWRKRQTTPFAEMTTDEIDFLLRTSEMVKDRNKFRRALEWGFYEDDLYFVSQMFEEEWTPRDTPIEFGDETISGVPLKQFGSPKRNEKA
ncbi:hypothetical protein BDZ45DRAFT_367421 [Acephala macrosclerotiorum]|nr:hypothetical protein BDZ45DRAFT_367421 [Acephala macrosclerotiorum]